MQTNKNTAGDVYDLREFCESHRISRAHFYDLKKEGLAPRIMKAGRKVLVTKEAAADWRRRMEEKAAS